MKKIIVDISSHGFGHIAQTAPVINALYGPGVEVTIRCGAPRQILEDRIACPFEWIPESSDCGILMKNAIDADVGATAANYAVLHRDWEARVEKEAEWIRAFDLVVSNVSYLPLKAAGLAGIPAAALCSLNWADLYRHYCNGSPECDEIHARILDAYRSAAFLRIDPAMPMRDLENARMVGPIAKIGKNRAEALRRILGLKSGDKIVLVSMGGVPFSIPFESWPRFEGKHWLVPAAVHRPDMTCFSGLGMSFSDLIASCDVLVTKPGYGGFVEAAASGIPVLYLSRPDWPEEPYLVGWLEENGRCLEVGRQALASGEIEDAVEALLSMPAKPVPEMTGIGQAAAFMASLLT